MDDMATGTSTRIMYIFYFLKDKKKFSIIENGRTKALFYTFRDCMNFDVKQTYIGDCYIADNFLYIIAKKDNK